MKFKSEFLNELQWRGFLSQITHEKELDEELASGAVKSYIGFDCTATCLHVGSLIQIMVLRLLQKYGHESIVLLGGGTTKIGDPSGKDESRKVLNDEKIAENMAYADVFNRYKFKRYNEHTIDQMYGILSTISCFSVANYNVNDKFIKFGSIWTKQSTMYQKRKYLNRI